MVHCGVYWWTFDYDSASAEAYSADTPSPGEKSRATSFVIFEVGLTIGSSDRGPRLRWAKEWVDDLD